MMRIAAAALSLLLLCACETVPREPSASGLGQTEWTLLDVRRPATAEPVEAPLNRYQMSLKGDGQASFKLDCNRGTGTWKAVPSAPAKGSLTFGPMATTRAFCQDNGMGDRLAAELSGTWPYEIYDGRLTITTANAVYTFDTIA